MAGERDGQRQADIPQADDDKLHTRSFVTPDRMGAPGTRLPRTTGP